MGLIIYPYLFLSILISFIGFLMILRSFYKKQIQNKEFIKGFIISIILYGLIFVDYWLSPSAYGLGTYFLIPFIMIWLPFIIALSLRFSKKDKLRDISRSILISVIFSCFFIFSFQKITFDLIGFLNIPKTF